MTMPSTPEARPASAVIAIGSLIFFSIKNLSMKLVKEYRVGVAAAKGDVHLRA